MRTIAFVFVSFCFVTPAFAEDSCKIQATGKSLHGAALTSFAKKCCKDQAAAQKLHGAAEIETVQQTHGCLRHKLKPPAWKNPQQEA